MRALRDRGVDDTQAGGEILGDVLSGLDLAAATRTTLGTATPGMRFPLAKRRSQNYTRVPQNNRGYLDGKDIFEEHRVLVHVVLMKFSDAGDAAEARLRLEALADVVPEIRSLQVRLDELATAVSCTCTSSPPTETPTISGTTRHIPPTSNSAPGYVPLLEARAVVDYTEA